ncbi:hypothetical protein [Neorhizobium tomejilense]|uniref:ATP dependent DNA ligase n=1 Tax=Neorhizobium tomejilense TaxID=2093828 RepID=UPI001FE0417C|nr:hypothetical protein [Neorhizobium tomejilense]
MAEEAARQAHEAVVGEGAGKKLELTAPALVAEIEYRAWTNDERLRHPSFKGLRDPDDISDVHRLRDQVAARVPATRTVTSFPVWRIDFSSG